MEGIRPLVGHNINLLIVMRFVKSNDAKSEGCSLVWQEVTKKAHPVFRGGHAKSRSTSELSSAFPRFRVL